MTFSVIPYRRIVKSQIIRLRDLGPFSALFSLIWKVRHNLYLSTWHPSQQDLRTRYMLQGKMPVQAAGDYEGGSKLRFYQDMVQEIKCFCYNKRRLWYFSNTIVRRTVGEIDWPLTMSLVGMTSGTRSRLLTQWNLGGVLQSTERSVADRLLSPPDRTDQNGYIHLRRRRPC